MTHTDRARRTRTAVHGPENVLRDYRPDISKLLMDSETPGFRHAQVLAHMLQRPLDPFARATNLPLEMRTSLDALGTSTLAVAASVSSSDGASKLLMRTHDDLAVETVLMRYKNRATACISSQIGCPVGCAFCATGTLGLTRNLSPAEIVDQVRVASVVLQDEGRRLTNLVYMGMGEPLLNLTSVLDSIRILTDSSGMNMAHRSISVSTVGIPYGIRRLAQAEPQVNLALSLHASDDRTRSRLIPSRFRHPITAILQAAWDHFEITRRKLLIEYVLIGGVNDSIDDARRLAALLRGHVVAVNLLPWNPVPGLSERPFTPTPVARGGREHPHSTRGGRTKGAPGTSHGVGVEGFRTPSRQAASAFRNTLASARIETVIRQSKGATIQAACGQLAAEARSYASKARQAQGK